MDKENKDKPAQQKEYKPLIHPLIKKPLVVLVGFGAVIFGWQAIAFATALYTVAPVATVAGGLLLAGGAYKIHSLLSPSKRRKRDEKRAKKEALSEWRDSVRGFRKEKKGYEKSNDIYKKREKALTQKDYEINEKYKFIDNIPAQNDRRTSEEQEINTETKMLISFFKHKKYEEKHEIINDRTVVVDAMNNKNQEYLDLVSEMLEKAGDTAYSTNKQKNDFISEMNKTKQQINNPIQDINKLQEQAFLLKDLANNNETRMISLLKEWQENKEAISDTDLPFSDNTMNILNSLEPMMKEKFTDFIKKRM